MGLTPSQAAEALYAAMPHAITQSILEEYGIEATAEQAKQITREMLSLNLYWIRSALDTFHPKSRGQHVFEQLWQRLLQHWQTELGLGGVDSQQYTEEMRKRCSQYDRVVREGGSPIAVLTEAVSFLEADRAVRPEDRQKLLALFLDLVPVDAFGEMIGEFELT